VSHIEIGLGTRPKHYIRLRDTATFSFFFFFCRFIFLTGVNILFWPHSNLVLHIIGNYHLLIDSTMSKELYLLVSKIYKENRSFNLVTLYHLIKIEIFSWQVVWSMLISWKNVSKKLFRIFISNKFMLIWIDFEAKKLWEILI
jgi:hypothetical protein